MAAFYLLWYTRLKRTGKSVDFLKIKPDYYRKTKIWFVLLLAAALAINLTVVLVYALREKANPDLYEPDRSKPPVLTYALNTLQSSAALNQYLQEYQAQGMAMKALILPVDSYIEKLNALFLAGMGPDVFEVPPTRIDTYRRKKWMRSLTTIGGELKEKWPDSKWPFAENEEIFTLPIHLQTIWLVCNQSLLEKAGVSSPPESLADFQEAAEKISRSNSGYGRYGFLLPMYGNQEYEFTLIEKMAAAGGDFFWNEESKRFYFENLEPYFTALSAMQATGALSPDYQMATHESAILQFAEGNIGMVLLDNQQIHELESANISFPYTVSLPPAVGGRSDIVQTPEGFLAVSADSVLTDSDIRRLLSPELFACITEEEGFHSISESNFQSSAFAHRYGFTENAVQCRMFKNNIYTYQRFSIYLSVLEDATRCQEKLEALSQTLSGSPAAKK